MSSLVLVAQSSQGGGMSMIIMMVAIFAIMWFFMIKPQQKKQKEIQKFQNELTEGTQVHHRSSEIIIGHQGQLRTIKNNQGLFLCSYVLFI